MNCHSDSKDFILHGRKGRGLGKKEGKGERKEGKEKEEGEEKRGEEVSFSVTSE